MRFTAKDVMHQGVTCLQADQTLQAAAERMRELDVGALPICDNDRLVGIVTDRDIVVKCVATGHDPAAVVAGEFVRGTPYSVEADAEIDDVLEMMEEHQIRRLPVLEDRRLVGIITEADICRNLSDEQVAQFVEAVCAPA